MTENPYLRRAPVLNGEGEKLRNRVDELFRQFEIAKEKGVYDENDRVRSTFRDDAGPGVLLLGFIVFFLGAGLFLKSQEMGSESTQWIASLLIGVVGAVVGSESVRISALFRYPKVLRGEGDIAMQLCQELAGKTPFITALEQSDDRSDNELAQKLDHFLNLRRQS